MRAITPLHRPTSRWRLLAALAIATVMACRPDISHPPYRGPVAQVLDITATRDAVDSLQVRIRLSGSVTPAVCVRYFQERVERNLPDSVFVEAIVHEVETCGAGTVPGRFAHELVIDSIGTPSFVVRTTIWHGRGLTRRLSVPF
jgi:hypothetical protein